MHSVQLPKNRKLIVEIKKPVSSRKFIVYLPGSSCEIFDLETSRAVNWLKARNDYGVVVINKAGISANSACRSNEFHRSSIRAQRIADVQLAMESELPASAQILLIGESEGGYLTADIANLDSRVKAIINLSGGTRSWIEEEIKLAAPHERAALEKFFRDHVIGHPSFNHFYGDTTYAQLNSYHTTETVEQLLRAAVPILMINGDHDRSIWVDGVMQDIKYLREQKGKTNIETQILTDANHGLACDDTTTCDFSRINLNFESHVSTFAAKWF